MSDPKPRPGQKTDVGSPQAQKPTTEKHWERQDNIETGPQVLHATPRQSDDPSEAPESGTRDRPENP